MLEVDIYRHADTNIFALVVKIYGFYKPDLSARDSAKAELS